MSQIWFIWLGVMGASMALNLLQAWHELRVFNRTKQKATGLVSAGAILADSVQELVNESDIIITIIWNPQSIEEVYFGDKGIFSTEVSWKILIDMTTTKPNLATKIYVTAKNWWAQSLDAPVSWGDVGAKNGTLSIMIWGDEVTYKSCVSLFETLWKTILYCGEAGMWQHTKMANQISIAWNTIALCESLLYSEKVWLNIQKTIEIVSAWAAGSWGWNNLAPRIANWELDTCFFIKHFLKDLRIVLDECRAMNIYLPGLSLAEWLYTLAQSSGKENLWTQALIEVLREMNSLKR